MSASISLILLGGLTYRSRHFIRFSGTIVELGNNVNTGKFKVGQNVVIEPVVSCMETSCGPCLAGTRNVCSHMTFIGIGGWGGGLSEYVSVKEEFVHLLPDGVSLEVGALMEPLSIVWHAANRANVSLAGTKVLIIGAGPIGLLLLKVVQARGASWIGVSEPALQRRNSAQKFGASAAYDPLSTDVVAAVKEATNGHGADVVFDCAGIQASINTAIAAVRARGTVVNVAVWEKIAAVDLNAMGSKEFTLTSTNGADRVHADLLKAVGDGTLTGLEELITKKIALEDVVDEGVKCLLAEKDTQIKILVHP